MAVGAVVEIETLPGYTPLFVGAKLGAIVKRKALDLAGDDGWAELGLIAASADAGDLSHVLPVPYPSHGGCVGTHHVADFRVEAPEAVSITPSKALA